jgi:hypothetical protein
LVGWLIQEQFALQSRSFMVPCGLERSAGLRPGVLGIAFH